MIFFKGYGVVVELAHLGSSVRREALTAEIDLLGTEARITSIERETAQLSTETNMSAVMIAKYTLHKLNGSAGARWCGSFRKEDTPSEFPRCKRDSSLLLPHSGFLPGRNSYG